MVKANVTIAADYNTFDTEPFRKTFASLANVSLAAVTVTKYPGSVILVTETALPTKDAKDTVVQILTNATTLSDALKDAPVPFDVIVEKISAVNVVEVEVPDAADTQSNAPFVAAVVLLGSVSVVGAGYALSTRRRSAADVVPV